MIDSLILFQMYFIGVCVFFQKSEARKMIAFTFAFMLISHDNYFHYLSDHIPSYYISAGILNFIVIHIIARMKETPRLAGDIQWISLIALVLNGTGWATYQPNHEPYVYMLMFSILYGLSIFTLLRGEPHGDIQTDTRFLSIRPDVCFRFISHHFKEKKECQQKHSQIQ